jgi:hypothetical protein
MMTAKAIFEALLIPALIVTVAATVTALVLSDKGLSSFLWKLVAVILWARCYFAQKALTASINETQDL